MLKQPTHTSLIELYTKIKVFKIIDIRDYQDLVYLYRLIHNLADDTFGEYLVPKSM